MAKIDDKKAYDMLPQSWIINYLKIFIYLEKNMKT